MKNHVCCFLLFTCCQLHIAVFSQQWHAIPNPYAPYSVGAFSSGIFTLKVINNDIYIGGGLCFGPSQTSCGIIKYNRTTGAWDSLGCGLPGIVHSIEFYNGEIYAGGEFSYYHHPPTCSNWPPDSSSSYLAKWNGSYWQSPDTNFLNNHPNTSKPLNGWVYSLQYKNDLFIGGLFGDFITMSCVVKYNGSTWDKMLGGVDGFPLIVQAMKEYKGELIVAGHFLQAGQVMEYNNIARWNGAQWDSLGSGVKGGGAVALEVDTINDILYVGGQFTSAGGIPVNGIAKWDGAQWSALPPFPTPEIAVTALKMFNGKLHAGTYTDAFFPYPDTVFFCLNGNTWQPIFGPYKAINALEVYDGNLYVGGYFEKIDTTTVNYIACYGDSCPGTPITVTLGINALQEKGLEFKIYPNPAKKEINIALSGPSQRREGKYIARIKNSLGQGVFERKFEKELKINTSDFKKGIYFLEVCTAEGRSCHAEKVVIE